MLLYLSVFLIWYVDCLPKTLFNDDTSTVLLDRNGELLNAQIATDGQWRFEKTGKVPYKIATCLVQFEDRNFYYHFGVSVEAIGRAALQNFSEGEVVSGGSTITMQVVRLMYKNPPRTYYRKMYEIILATRIEFSYSKEEILQLYASNAPFGGNVVGIDAASWRYFGRPSNKLSWAESATLSVLPNAPGLIHPGKNREQLRKKRNRLLKQLYSEGIIDQTEYELALLEPIPEKPHSLPQAAPHLMQEFIKQGKKGQTIHSTLDFALQQRANEQLRLHHDFLEKNRISNGAIVIASVETGEILAYVGNTLGTSSDHGNYVNCVVAKRSSGSILKPFLYAKSLEGGIITPKSLLSDVPSFFGKFSPKNYSGGYDGLVPADKVISRSLNIPMVHLLNGYGLGKFHRDLNRFGFETIDKSSRHYGLSLILGGAEVRLQDLTQAYLQWAQELKYGASKAIFTDRDHPSFMMRQPETNPACIYSAFQAMTELHRPNNDMHWEFFESSRKIAWKTGTSFGFRDAWAVGVTPEYVVSVWIGNADGEGRPGLTGVQAAAPLLFRLFDQLPTENSWFKAPNEHQVEISICVKSGKRSSDICPQTSQQWIPKTCLESSSCSYHQRVHLDKTEKFRVNSECADVFSIKTKIWFNVPALNAKYYSLNHPDYRALPPLMPGCQNELTSNRFALLYPKSGKKIYLTKELDGELGAVVFEAVHHEQRTILYWHLDNHFLGETSEIHQMTSNPSQGKHTLTVLDEEGNSVSCSFEVQ
ncbi:MAG: penicillin-binding protein 1C [Crocinitomicaceae bacterium]